MAREKKPVHKVQMTEGKRNIIHQLLDEYDIQSAEDIQEALKDLLGGTIKEMMEAEMDDNLGYSCAMKLRFQKFGNQSSSTRKSPILCLMTYPFLLGYWSRPCRICGA